MNTQMITGTLNGKVVFSIPQTALNDDWIRVRRLMIAAKQGDEKAKNELEKLRQTYMIEE